MLVRKLPDRQHLHPGIASNRGTASPSAPSSGPYSWRTRDPSGARPARQTNRHAVPAAGTAPGEGHIIAGHDRDDGQVTTAWSVTDTPVTDATAQDLLVRYLIDVSTSYQGRPPTDAELDTGMLA